MDDEKLDQLRKYYDTYDANQKRELEISIIKYMLKFKHYIITMHESIPKDIYNKLEAKMLKGLEEEKKLRDVIVNMLCEIEN